MAYKAKLRKSLLLLSLMEVVTLPAGGKDVKSNDTPLPAMHAGAFQRIYDPSINEKQPWYINDHCFIQDDNGIWHMFGITHAEPAAPLDEKHFAHATSKTLLNAQWKKESAVMQADRALGEMHVWAPHIVRWRGIYYMFYCAGGEDFARYRIHLATSTDLWHWKRYPENPLLIDGFCARDPMVLRDGNQWIMYYCATSRPEGGNYVVAAVVSEDLLHWRHKRQVFVHPRIGTAGGPTESPFVLKHDNKYYLFLCTNDPYNSSAVYESATPFEWQIENCVGTLPAHAAEIITIGDKQTFISRAGWGQGGLYLAPLTWRKLQEAP